MKQQKMKQAKSLKKKQYAVFGLGVFGSSVAETLEKYGCEVLAVDQNVTLVERISKKVTKAVVADVTSKEELLSIDIGDLDVVIIALTNNLEGAVLATMISKELGVPYIITKAKNHQHQQILERVGADKIVHVERDMGERIAKGLLHKSIVDIAALDDRYAVAEIKAPIFWHGQTVVQLNVRHVYKMNLLGVKHNRSNDLSLNINPGYKIQEGDSFLVIAQVEDLENFDYLY